MNVDLLPAVNATLNGTAAILLFAGWRAIQSGNRNLHRALMLTACIVSALFLASYLTYHSIRVSETGQGHTVFPYGGWLKALYYTILFTHIPLAMAVVPWMYVSVTGVLIYLMLYHL
jgi:uncharacterized membrane protein YozB (DUF420 family)